ncbi:MAG: ABC transporter ATP-binding protein [Jatrophihabitantaceae bacterium]
MGSAEPVMEAIGLTKHFRVYQRRRFGMPMPGAAHAVDDVSLALYAGQITALVGESGSGKSTITRLLARLYAPTAGVIKLGGTEVRRTRGKRSWRRYTGQVQLILQDPFSSLNPVHTVQYHLGRPLRLHGHAKSRGETRDQVRSLLAEVSLSPPDQFVEKFPHELSGGQRQRVAIARSLAAQPSVLLADEPVSMLDVSIRLDLLNVLAMLAARRHLAILYVTHDIASARYLAQTILVMYAGQLIEGGPSEAVTQQPAHPYAQLLLSAAPDPERLGAANDLPTKGEPPSLVAPPAGCRFHPRCPMAMDVCRSSAPPRTVLSPGHWVHCWLHEPQARRVTPSAAAGR